MPPLFRIKSCWSKAGIGTCTVIQHNAGPSLVLDLGATPNYGDALQASVILLTHGHLDHVGAIFSHARAYALQHSGVSATYYAPLDLVPLLQRAKECLEALDSENDRTGPNKGGLPMQFIGVKPGDEFFLPIKKRLNGDTIFVRVFQTFHGGSPSVGYVVGVRKRSTLKKQYVGMTSDELKELTSRNLDIKESIETLEVAYTGDTTVETFDQAPDTRSGLHLEQAYQCHYFLTETTMLDDVSRPRVHSIGHMHLLDVVDAVVPRVCHHLVLLHVSARYDASTAMGWIADAIPSDLPCSVAIASLDRVHQNFGGMVSNNGLLLVSAYKEQQNQKGQDREATKPSSNDIPSETL